MSSCLLLFPNQLIRDHPIFNEVDAIYLIEHPVFFTNRTKHRPYCKLNRLRCTYHRATQDLWMQSQQKRRGFNKKDIRWFQLKDRDMTPFPTQKELRAFKTIYMLDPDDADIVSEIEHLLSFPVAPSLSLLPSPLFLFTKEDLDEYIETKQSQDVKTVMKHVSFYTWARHRLSILINSQKKVIGGKLSWDMSNRCAIPKTKLDSIQDSYETNYTSKSKHKQIIRDAWRWSCEMFADHYGPDVKTDIKDIYSRLKWYAMDHRQARNILSHFISHKLHSFGTYQDAIGPPDNKNSIFLFHSNLSHAINNGLLSPLTVIKEVEDWFYSRKDTNTHNLAQAEGFIRQVLGWREFARLGAYKFRDYYWTANNLKASKSLTKEWYEGTTGIEPVDVTIHKAFDTGYLHHIERLMIMGNYMTLYGMKPKDMYKWFMEFSMDSYDWVMIVNVFGMAAHSDAVKGPTFTKPYISSSNYVLKMSHYKKKDSWTKKWDDSFYAFLRKHKDIWSKNPRMSLMMRLLEKNPQ